MARRRAAKSGMPPVVVDVLTDTGATAASHRHSRYSIHTVS